ncbi:hypothetical protein [Chitinophaga filiformis]|uniref:Uncharacterized protein n=1 Tax=Chitinophaga filiformis TaxID=104663 RepID=A0A1G8A546_CHIFI|nr:hypothetical protein [Chitinophaga filiformis]SDH16105.1 hypothetical protein SAMN04488121_109126 [Chitinophaga filiformis]
MTRKFSWKSWLSKKKELDLKIQEQRSKRIFTPLLVSIIGGLITVITGIALKYFDNRATLALEDKKFQSSILLKATEAANYQEFSDIIVAFQENGLLALDSAKLTNFRKKRFLAEKIDLIAKNAEPYSIEIPPLKKKPGTTSLIPHYDVPDTIIQSVNNPDNSYWLIVAGGDKDIDAAKYEMKRSVDNGFKDVALFFRQNYYRTAIGKYSSYIDACNTLFDVKEKINNTSYVVRSDKWCANPVYDAEKKLFVCK